MRVPVTAAALLSTQRPLVNALEYLEPNVQRHVGVLPPSVCKELIEQGEEAGFLIREESIDENEQKDRTKTFVPSQTINVYDKGSDPGDDDPDDIEIENELIWELLQPWIPKIAQIVKDNRNKEAFNKFYPDNPDREPELNWVFFRKYSPNGERNSLQHHHDTNMNTVNIELADDYEGGGLFYIKPLASTREIDEKYGDMGYEWIDSLKKENTSELVFPDLHCGDAIFYNYTVEHGVAPVKSGIRYSMAFFFDMDNPAVKDDFDEDSSDDSEDEYLDAGEFKVELHNGLPDVELDIFLVYDGSEEKIVRKRVFDNVVVNETTVYYAIAGDSLRALRAGTDEVVSDFEIKRGQYLYTISEMNDSVSSEL